jgi:hypothetical protein
MADGAERLILGTFDSARLIGGILRIRLVDRSWAGSQRYAIEVANGRECLAALRNFEDIQDDDPGF